MTQQQMKAKEIVINMQYQEKPLSFEQAKKCSLISVIQILDVIKNDTDYQNVYNFFLEVKSEIEKL